MRLQDGMMSRSQGSVTALAFGVGAAALAAQTLLVRELMAGFYGTELALAAAMSCWLAFVAFGALAGTLAVRAAGGAGRLHCAAVIWLALGIPAQLLAARLVRPVLGAGPGAFLALGPMLLGAGAAAALAAAPVGLFFAPASRVAEERAAASGRGIGKVYVGEAFGSGLAGAALSLVLLGAVPSWAIAVGSACLLLALGAVEARAAGCRRVSVCLGAAGVVSLLAAAVAGPRIDSFTQGLRWATFSTFRRVAAEETRYQHVEVGESGGEFVLVQNGIASAQFPDVAAARASAALVLTQHPAPRNVLVIGGGLEGPCQAMLAAPIERLDHVAPDPALTRLLIGHLPPELRAPLDDPRFRSHPVDGRYFVARMADMAPGPARANAGLPANGYDLVVVNLGDPTSAASSRFYTAEFCSMLRGVAAPGGAVAYCGITGSENYARGAAVLDYTGCLYRTLRAVFPIVVVRPGAEVCFFAARTREVVSADAAVLAGRFDALGLRPEALRYCFDTSEFPPGRVAAVTAVLDDALASSAVNTDARPLLFTLYLEIQAQFAGGFEASSRSLVARARRAGPVRLMVGLPCALAACLAVVLWRRGRRRSVASISAAAVGTTGAFGLTAAMLIVYGYQMAYGYVYRDVSVIAGLFMVGLACGGWLSGRLLPTGQPSRLTALEGAQAAFIVAVPWVSQHAAVSPLVFAGLSVLAGLLTGSVFPAAARLCLRGGGRPGVVAGVLDAADHAGATLGAAFAGLLLIPAFGLPATALLIAGVKCASMVGILALAPASDGPSAA